MPDWDGSASRFSDEQYARSCVLDKAICDEALRDAPPKTRYSLPVREPGGAVNKTALSAAAGRLNQTDACAAAKRRAASTLARMMRAADMEPPEGVKRMAGGAGMSSDDHLADVRKP